MTITYTLPIELNAVVTTTAEKTAGLSTIDQDGLHLSTGYGFYDNVSYAQLLDTTPSLVFPSGTAPLVIGAIGGDLPTTLTTALFKNINLVAGETLTITYNYNSTEATSSARTAFGETRANDFAFAVLGSPTATTQFGLLARTDIVTAVNLTPTSSWSESFQITQNGLYKLLIGNADVRDTTLNSTLTIKSITVTAPDTIAQQTPAGLTFLDGSQFLVNGTEALAGGQTVDGFLSAGAQQLLAAGIISQDGGGIVATGGGNAIARAGTGLISQDGGGLISQDGGGLISQDGGGLFGPDADIVSHDAGGIVSHDAGGIVSHDAGGIVSHDAGGIVSHDAGGLVSAGNGLTVRLGVALKAATPIAQPAISPAKIGGEIQVGEAAPSYTHQNNPVIAALTTGQLVVAWSDDNTSSGHFEVRAQLLNPDGSKAAPSFLVSTSTSSDQITPSVAALADGHFAVSWRGPASGAADLHTQLFDGFGAKVGADIHVGTSGVNETAPHTATLTGGGFVTVFETTIPGVFDSNAGGGRLYAADGAAGAIFGFGSTSDPTTKGGATVTGLQDGGFAIAYRETNSAASDQDGIYLDVYAADGTQTHGGIHVNTTSTGVQNAPAIATLHSGDIVVSWVDAGDTTTNNGVKPIRAQIFHADGAKVGGEFLIGKTLSGSDAPTITSLSDGRFAITWDATSQTAGTVTGLNLTTQFFTADGALSGTPVADNPVSRTDAYREQSPAATQLGNGTFAVVGSKTNGGTSTITANLFNLDGTGTPPASAADLKVTTAFLDKTVAGPGDTINLSYQLKNAGTLPAGASTSKIYISDDATITSSDRLVGTLVEPGLLAGTSVSDTLDIVIPSDLSPGVHYVGIIADANGQVGESNEANNVSAPVVFGPPAHASGTQFQVDTGTAATHDASGSHVTALSNGGYVVTWTDTDQSNAFNNTFHDVGQVFTASGAKVGGAFDVEAVTGGQVAQNASVSALSGGQFVAAWSENNYVDGYSTYQSNQIRAQIFSADGSRSGSVIVVDPGVSDPATKTQFQGSVPSVTTLADGRFLVTYAYEKRYDHSLTFLDAGQTTGIVEGHIYNPDGSSAGPAFQVSTSPYVSNPTYAYHPVVASLAGGGFVVTYQGSDYIAGTTPAYSGILAQIYDGSGHAVGSEFIVNSQRDYDQDFQDVVGLTNGNFVVTWRDDRASRETLGAGEDQSYNGVYAQVLTATGQRIGGQFLVNTTTLSDQGLAKVTALPDGRFVVTWTDSSGASGDSHDDVRAQVFNPDGAKSGAELLVNTTLAGVQQFSSIAALTNDDFVVAWQDGYTTFPSHRAIEAQAFAFGTAAPLKPDLTVTSPSLDAHAATAGQTVHLTYTVNNVGPGNAAASTSKVYLSSSTTVTSADRLVATQADAAITAGQSHSDTVAIVLPSDLSYGTYQLAVIADAAGQVSETVEINNVSTISSFTVTAPTLSGRAIDGYLAGATVWGDADGDGVLDPGEISTQTDASGAYTLVGATGPLVALGGTDIATGLAFRGVLTAPAGSGVITPLTTLVDALGRAGVADPVGKVLAGFGLPAGFDLLGTDPVAAAASGNPSGRAALVAGAAVIDTVALLAAGLSGATGQSLTSASAAVGLSLAGHFNGSPVNLTSETFLAGLGGEAGLSSSASAATARAASLLNTSLLDASGATDLSTALAATQTLAQGSVATALFDAHGDAAGLSGVAAGIQAVLPTLTPPAPSAPPSAPATPTLPTSTPPTHSDPTSTPPTHADQASTTPTQADPTPTLPTQPDATPTLPTQADPTPTLPAHVDSTLFGTYVHDASGAGGQVFEFYEGLLGRAPDALGLSAWADAIGHGASLASVAQGFLASSEYTAAHGPISAESDAGFVSELYHVVLDRAGDAAGTAFWTDALSHGTARGDVAAALALSPEHLAQDSALLGAGVFVADPSKADIARLYYAAMDRAPDAGGLTSWSSAVAAGLSETALAQSFLSSPEYAATHGAAPSPEAFVTGLYDGALGRAPDAGGLAFWTSALSHGESRADVALAIGESPEAKLHHLGHIEQGWHLA